MSYLPPTPALHRVTFVLEFSEDPGDCTVTVSATGTSAYKRGTLWREAEVFTESSDHLKLAPADWIHHVALCSLQDRPNTTERLLFSLTGGLGIQTELF